MTKLHAVTGAFGYSGKSIARRLLAQGLAVRTLTNSRPAPGADIPGLDGIDVQPLCFDDPDRLTAALTGVEVLYNTYWVRFNHQRFTHLSAVDNTLALFAAAKRAGVRRIVHTSITNPDADSSLSYFRGKAQLEDALRGSGLSFAILRPAVLFGDEDILINNIAWLLRRFPLFGVFGSGRYRLQPIFVQDFARLAVEHGAGSQNVTVDAIGPETFTYRELVQTVAAQLGLRRAIISIPPVVGYWLGRALGRWLGDVVITRDEIEGLMADLLVTDSPPAGETRLSHWLHDHRETVGMRYANELARRQVQSARGLARGDHAAVG